MCVRACTRTPCLLLRLVRAQRHVGRLSGGSQTDQTGSCECDTQAQLIPAKWKRYKEKCTMATSNSPTLGLGIWRILPHPPPPLDMGSWAWLADICTVCISMQEYECTGSISMQVFLGNRMVLLWPDSQVAFSAAASFDQRSRQLYCQLPISLLVEWWCPGQKKQATEAANSKHLYPCVCFAHSAAKDPFYSEAYTMLCIYSLISEAIITFLSNAYEQSYMCFSLIWEKNFF